MLKLGLLLLIVPPLALMGLYFHELSAVRECTLVEGGHWDYLEGVCRDTRQPFVPWVERAPWLVNGGMGLSVVGLVMVMARFYVRKR